MFCLQFVVCFHRLMAVVADSFLSNLCWFYIAYMSKAQFHARTCLNFAVDDELNAREAAIGRRNAHRFVFFN